MVSFIVFNEKSGKLLFQHCKPSLWNILDKNPPSRHYENEIEELTRTKQEIHETNLLMQAFLPLLLSAKMLECRVIRTENWTILFSKAEGKFITFLVGEDGINEHDLQYYEEETHKLMVGLCGSQGTNLKDNQEFQRKFRILFNRSK